MLRPHPFATVEGYKKLAEYLHATDLKDEPAAIEAAKALGFFGKVDRALQSAAASHGSMRVRIEAAYAAAKMEDEDGVNQLGQLSANPAVSNLACKYLEQLEREDAISPLAEEEEFMATADLYEWLGQDEQRGRPPDDVELMDTRQMHWPPLDERPPDARRSRLEQVWRRQRRGARSAL